MDVKPFLHFASSAGFRAVLQALRQTPPTGADALAYTLFFVGDKARQIHHTTQLFHINGTLHTELALMRHALSVPSSYRSCPIMHLVPRTSAAIIRGDALLDAASGYSANLGFWWHLEWPPKVRAHTLRYIKNNRSNQLISINSLEYAVILINYAAPVFQGC